MIRSMVELHLFFAALAARLFARPWGALAVAAALAVVAGLSGTNLRISADLSELLPEDAPSVVAARQTAEEFGETSTLVVLAEGAPRPALERFADDIAREMSAVEGMGQVEARRPVEFFERRALYYLSVAELERLKEQLGARKRYEVRQRNPFFVSLQDEEAPAVSIEAILDKDRDASFQGADPRALADEPYYLDEESREVIVVARPATPALDLSSSARLVDQTRAAIERLDPGSYDPGMRVSLGGGHVKRIEQQAQIVADLGLTGLVAMILIAGYLWLSLGRLGAVLLVGAPLALGVVWTYGLAAWLFPTLNILTAFVAVILLSIGIDHGVHLARRLSQEWAAEPGEGAARRAFDKTSAGVLTAAATTAIAFAALSASHFRAFQEFGILASASVALTAAAYLIVFPALAGAMTRLGWRPSAPRHQRAGRPPRIARFLARPGIVLGATLVLGLGAAAGLGRLSFNYDSRAMAGALTSFDLDARIDRLLGVSQSPVILLARSAEEARGALGELRARKRDGGEGSGIAALRSVDELVPPRQEEKRELVDSIYEIAKDLKREDLEPEDRRIVDGLRLEQGPPAPFSFAELPGQVRRAFEGKGGEVYKRVILLYSSLDLSDGYNTILLSRELEGLGDDPSDPLLAVGAPLIQADVIELVFQETPRISIWVVVVVFLVVLLAMRSLEAAAIATGVAVLTLLFGGGVMGWLGVQFNYINTVIVAVAFGMGVDGAAHLLNQSRRAPGDLEGMAEVSAANAGALVTTALGFGAMKLADHPGITSLADVTLIAIAVNFALTVFALPAFLAWRAGRQSA